MRRCTIIILTLLAASCVHKDGLTLHYDRPAQYFEQALPIGNGRLGAMVYGGTAVDSLSLNDITLWTGEPDKGMDNPDLEGFDYTGCVNAVREALDREDYPRAEYLQQYLQGHYSQTYQPLGWLKIDYGDDTETTGYKRSLDISKAVASTSFLKDGIPFDAEYFASAPDSVIVLRLTSARPFSAKITFSTPHPSTVSPDGDAIITDGYVAYHAFPGYYYNGPDQFKYDPERGIHFRTIVSATGGKATDGGLEISGKDVTVYIVNATSFAGFDRDPSSEGLDYKALADANMDRARRLGAGALRRRHISDYRRLFGRFAIDLGETPDSVRALPTDEQLLRYTDLEENNPDLEELYCQYGRYLLISSSRTRGVPANLQGLWNEKMDPPWSCNYTVNINLEENYWPVETLNLSELHEVLLDFTEAVAVNGAAASKDIYGIQRGWSMGHNSDIWAMAQPVGLRSGHPSWANWTMGGAWLSTHIWEHYLFTRDLETLKHYYPVLKGAAEFCLDWMIEKDGCLMTSPGTSPENLYVTPDGFVGATLYGGTADVAIIRECLTDAREAAILLGDEAFAEEAAEVLGKLLPYRVSAAGTLQEWYHDWADYEPTHRHQSHLFGLYPGHQITPQDTLAKACARTLEVRGFNTTGWSCGWRINLYARLGDGESAYRMFRRLLRYVSPYEYRGPDARRGGGTYPNLMDAHSPFQIDGNFGGAAGVVEMLVQSTETETTLLPARPKAWEKGSVKGVRSREGKEISFKWKEDSVY